jgi:uncharacterized protein (TIGR03083 family)
MLPPIRTAHLLPLVDAKLIDLLRSLTAREWDTPTVAPARTVRDVAAHLLDTQQRLVSRLRGEPLPPSRSIGSHADLVAFIDRLNAEGVARYRRLEPAALIVRLEEGSPLYAAHHQSLDPLADAPYAVSWAGETRSANWFHTARELTERWHHQQQIRLAVGRPGIMTRELYHPVLDCFMRALPFAYRDRRREPGTVARFTVEGDCGGSWHLSREAGGWDLIPPPTHDAVSETRIPQEIAWRIFTKGIARDAAATQVRVSGDADLGGHVLRMVAIVG